MIHKSFCPNYLKIVVQNIKKYFKKEFTYICNHFYYGIWSLWSFGNHY